MHSELVFNCMCVYVLACLFVGSILAKENFLWVPAESLDVSQGQNSLASPELQFLSLQSCGLPKALL